MSQNEGKTQGKKLLPLIVVAVAAVLAVFAIVFFKTRSTYETPIKLQVAGIKKGDINKYAKSFTEEGRKFYLEDFTKEEFKEYTGTYHNFNYKITNVEAGSPYDVWEMLWYYDMTDEERQLRLSTIEEIENVTVETTYNYENEKELSTYEITMLLVKIKGKWYAMGELL